MLQQSRNRSSCLPKLRGVKLETAINIYTSKHQSASIGAFVSKLLLQEHTGSYLQVKKLLSKHLIDGCFCRSIDVFLTETGAVLDVQENRGKKSVLLRSYVAHSAHWRRVRIRGRFSPSYLTILQTHKWLKLTCILVLKLLLLIQVFKISPMWPVGHCSSFVAKRKMCTILFEVTLASGKLWRA